ncbi:unnamed protein product [Lathyrus oleraceus]
MKRVKRKL